MNLAEETLIPLKTKGLMADGRKVVFAGNVGGYQPYKFFCESERRDGQFLSYVTYASDGICTPAPSVSLAKLIKRWEPRVGDVVNVIGVMGHDSGWSWSAGRSDYEITRVGTLVEVKDSDGDTRETHRDQLRLVRRPPGGTNAST